MILQFVDVDQSRQGGTFLFNISDRIKVKYKPTNGENKTYQLINY